MFKRLMMVLGIVATIAVSILVVGQDEKIWNNGCHAKDGGHWVYETEYKARHANGSTSTTYYYTCDKCNTTEGFLEKR